MSASMTNCRRLQNVYGIRKIKMKKCCICKKKIKGDGNNPLPLYNKEGICCDECNMLHVIPARLTLIKASK